MGEKRRYPRFDITAKIKFKQAGLEDLKDAFVKDISAEGFCFSSNQQLNPGDTLDLEIIESIMQEEPIYVKVQVAWSKKAPESKDGKNQDSFLTGVRVLGIRKSDEARFAMLYCERVLAELRSSLRL